MQQVHDGQGVEGGRARRPGTSWLLGQRLARSARSWPQAIRDGDWPDAAIQSVASSTYASSQYVVKNSHVMDCSAPQVTHHSWFLSKPHSGMQWPPQLPATAFGPVVTVHCLPTGSWAEIGSCTPM